MKEDMMAFASRLKALRGKRSQTEFANLFGVPQPSYAKWEAGTAPTALNIIKVCQATGVSADWLLGLKEGEARASIVGNGNAQAVNGSTASVTPCKDCQTVAHLLEAITALSSRKGA